MTTRQTLLPLFACLSLAVTPCLAQTEKAGETRSNMNAPDIEPWKERATSLPPYPVADNLVALESSYFDGRYEYLIDTESLLVGEDGIARYTVVIRKPGGSRQHVIHEGLRCATRLIRLYGMASGNEFALKESDWQPISLDGPYVYRRALYEEYMCSQEGGPLKPRFIQARLRGDANAGVPGGNNSYYTGRR